MQTMVGLFVFCTWEEGGLDVVVGNPMLLVVVVGRIKAGTGPAGLPLLVMLHLHVEITINIIWAVRIGI
jgi:hypothetical protein